VLENTNQPQPAWPNQKWASDLAALVVCVYIGGLALPVPSTLWLIVLPAGGLWIIIFSRLNQLRHPVTLLVPLLIFLGATALSAITSEDPSRSLRLSAPIAPAFLLFFLIADCFEGAKHTRLLYLTCSAVGLAISLEVLWSAWRRHWAIPPGWENWLSDFRSPLLVVPNDTVLLAVVAPLSLALLFGTGNGLESKMLGRRKRLPNQVLPAASIVLSMVAVCVIRSRIATLTIIVSLAVAAALVRPRLAIAYGLGVTAVVAVVDASLGFPLLTKFARLWGQKDFWNGRLPIWSAAWTGFTTSPILGHGPHTFSYVSPARIHLRWAHNLYLEILCEQGIIGFGALALVLYQVFSAVRANYHRNIPEERWLCAGASAAWIGFSLAGIFELTFLREWVVTIFFVLLGSISQLSWYKQQQENNT
jgi:O-antigen ligase